MVLNDDPFLVIFYVHSVMAILFLELLWTLLFLM